MGIFQDLKYKQKAQLEYKGQASLAKADIVRHSAAEEQAKEKLDKLIELQKTGERDEQFFCGWNAAYLDSLQANPDTLLERAIAEAEQDYIRWSQVKQKAEKKLLYMRPNTKEDIEERKAAAESFAKEVLAVDPNGALDLRFHSTTLATTRDIIESGGLISSVDRMGGFIQTTNLSNEISVSDIQNIQYSIDYWTDISGYTSCEPCGCVFVLQPLSAEEANMISGRQMHNVLFKENPDQLVAIATTSENINRVQTWLMDNGLSPDIVCRFDEMSFLLETRKKDLFPAYRNNKEINVLISDALVRAGGVADDKTQDYIME